jgi:hypothetical protein
MLSTENGGKSPGTSVALLEGCSGVHTGASEQIWEIVVEAALRVSAFLERKYGKICEEM